MDAMDVKEFKKFGKAAIECLANYIETIRERPVLPRVEPGYLQDLLPDEMPESPEKWERVMNDFENFILPGITHWQSPRFHGYFPTAFSFPAIIGELLGTGLGIIGFNWMASPACTELEVITLNWLGKILGIPKSFLNCAKGLGGGVIQGSASESTFICLLAAKQRKLKRILKEHPDWSEDFIKGKMTAYTSDQSNSSVEKAGILASIKLRLLETDERGSVRGETVLKAIKEDIEHGFIPTYFCATLGTTVTCAFDNLQEIGPICRDNDIWMHVDAAYAGAAFVCPEYRHLMSGIEFADSFNFNPHKWLLVNFDCSALWVKDSSWLIEAFKVDRIYLKYKKQGVPNAPDYRDWQIPLGRKFRSLKLWITLRVYGQIGLQNHIRRQIELAKEFECLVKKDSRFELAANTAMGLVCFRLKGPNRLTQHLQEELTARGIIFTIAGEFRGIFFIRFVVCSPYTGSDDVLFSWNEIQNATTALTLNQRENAINSRHVCTTSCNRVKECPKCPAANAKFVDVCKLDKCMVNPCKPEPSVVIVGGGIAGLSAAQRLVHCGIRNFTVLEATDRPGGRIHSCWMGDVVAEMGAQYINGGCIANPVFTLAAQEGLLSNPLPRPDERGLFCTSDGRAIDFPVSVTAYHTFKKIEQQAAALFSMGCGRSHGNLLNFLGIRIQQELHNFPEEQRYDAARVMYGLTNILRTKCGDDLSLISADQFGSYIEIPGGDVRVPLGYVGVLAPLLRDLPECSVRYCKPVQNIMWGTVGSSCGPRAIVKCCDGEEFQADYVIVTVSLGVLKAKHDKLFCPALPCEKVEAIRKLGFGVVNKIFLEYTRPFWVWREGGIKLAWSADELASRDDWIKGLCYVEELAGSQHVLCAWVAGREATTMELCSEEEVAESITRVLRQFTGDPCLPYPANVLRSKWTADCNFCGSYSYMGLESNVGQQCDLGSPVPGSCEPVAPILLFAGEATVPGHYSTVHGARLSGIREAERIIQLTKRFGGPPVPPDSVCCCP